MTINAYPLTWPAGMPRSTRREDGQFKTQLTNALKNVTDSLRKFGTDSGKPITNIILSSNCSLGVDKPADPGIAAWFMWDGLQYCIPVDRYRSPASNLQAIHHIIEARRVELRHGTLALVRATFTGFISLPAPADQKTWREVLFPNGYPEKISLDLARSNYRALASQHHPDKGGSTDMMTAINQAWEQAQQELAK